MTRDVDLKARCPWGFWAGGTSNVCMRTEVHDKSNTQEDPTFARFEPARARLPGTPHSQPTTTTGPTGGLGDTRET